MVGLVLDAERCLQQDDGRVLVTGRSLTAKLQLLQQQQPQLDAIEQELSSVEDNIPITFTKVRRHTHHHHKGNKTYSLLS